MNRYDDIKPIETEYEGNLFRSRLEAKWAVYFNLLGYDFKYEPEGFTDGIERYLPDFYIPELNVYVEIKPEKPNETELRKINMLSKKIPVLLCVDEPGLESQVLFENGKRGLDVVLTFGSNRKEFGEYFYTDSFNKDYFSEEYFLAKKASRFFYKNNVINRLKGVEDGI